MRARLVPIAAAALVSVLSAPATAQWIKYPTPGIPRLPAFLSSVSQVAIEFVKDARGAVTHFVRTGAGKDGKAVRKGNAVQNQKK